MSSIPLDAGWSEAYAEFVRCSPDAPALPERLGRIASEHRGGFTVMTEAGEALAQAPANLRRKLEAIGEDKPAVGDWVGYEPVPDGSLILRSVLPRRTRLRRRRPGSDRPQVLVANVDRVLVVTSVGRDLNPRRLERYFSVILDGGAEPVVVLSKADLDTDRDASLDVVAKAGAARTLFVSSVTGEGLDAIGALAPAGITVAMLGSSGVGKSSLANALIGTSDHALAIGALTDGGKGRHTTTRRELLRLPSGGVLIDTPGMRELGLWAAESGLSEAFPEVEKAGSECRFADCRHENEPGCGICAALANGGVTQDRVDSYLKLMSELAEQRSHPTAADKRQQARGSSRGLRSRLRDRGRK